MICDISDTHSFCRLSGSACVPSSWICLQRPYHSGHTHRVSHLYGISYGLVEARAWKSSYCKLGTYASIHGLRYALIMQAWIHTSSHSEDTAWLVGYPGTCESACVGKDWMMSRNFYHTHYKYTSAWSFRATPRDSSSWTDHRWEKTHRKYTRPSRRIESCCVWIRWIWMRRTPALDWWRRRQTAEATAARWRCSPCSFSGPARRCSTCRNRWRHRRCCAAPGRAVTAASSQAQASSRDPVTNTATPLNWISSRASNLEIPTNKTHCQLFNKTFNDSNKSSVFFYQIFFSCHDETGQLDKS